MFSFGPIIAGPTGFDDHIISNFYLIKRTKGDVNYKCYEGLLLTQSPIGGGHHIQHIEKSLEHGSVLH